MQMAMTQLVSKLAAKDAKLFGRESFVVALLCFGLLIAVVVRYLLPWANTALAEQGFMPSEVAPISLSDVYPMIVTFMGLFNGALLAGVACGFLLIDEKEQLTLKAMRVTPVPMKRYVLYKITVSAVIAAFILPFEMLIMNQALLPLWQLIVFSIGAALLAPIATLYFGIVAENKVQGFAMSKFISIAGWVIMIGWFIPQPWQWLFALFPPFLIHKAYWMALEGNSYCWLVLIAGVISQIGLIYWMMNKYNQGINRLA